MSQQSNEPDNSQPDVDHFEAFMAWMKQANDDNHTVPEDIHWRSMARILTLVSGYEPVDWQELRDNSEQVLRQAFTRTGESPPWVRDGDVMPG